MSHRYKRSHKTDISGLVVKLVSQQTFNLHVQGSSPCGATTYGVVADWNAAAF